VKVAELAAKYFGADPSTYGLITEDGRAYMRRSEKKYDVVLLDVFSGGGQPFHLFSQESFQDIKRILSPGGVVGINAIAFPEGEMAIMAQSLLKTGRSVFPEFQIFVGDPGEPMDEIQNILMFFSESGFAQTDAGTPAAKNAQSHLTERPLKIDWEKGRIVTDDLNPVDRWTARVNEVWRERLFNTMGPKVLAY